MRDRKKVKVELHEHEGQLVSVPESERHERLDALERLCQDVAGLDDCGLSVFHKSAINRARKLLKARGK